MIHFVKFTDFFDNLYFIFCDMVKKILISSIIGLFLWISQTFAWVEYIIWSVWGTPINGYNVWVDNEYYVSYYNRFWYIWNYLLYSKTWSLIWEWLQTTSIDYVPTTFYKWSDFLILNWINQFWQWYYSYVFSWWIDTWFTPGSYYVWYNDQQPLYIYNNSILTFYNWWIYERTNKSQWALWWTSTWINIPESAFHTRSENHKIIYNWWNYNIYFDWSSYFLEWLDENWYINFEVFDGDLLWTDLERLNLDQDFKDNIVYSKFYTFSSNNQTNYYLSACYNTGKTLNTWTWTITSNNITFRWYKNTWDVSQWFNYIDNKYYKNVYQWNWLKQLNYTDFSNFWWECNPTITYWDFNWNVPWYIQYVRSWILYKYVFDANDLIQFTWNTEIWWTWSTATENFWTWWTLDDDTIINDIWNIDSDWDWTINSWEAVIAPYTIAKNVVNKFLESLKNIWKFLEAIAKIWQTWLIPNANADNIERANILFWKTGDMLNWESDRDWFNFLFNMAQYGIFFIVLIFIIIFIMIYRIKNK